MHFTSLTSHNLASGVSLSCFPIHATTIEFRHRINAPYSKPTISVASRRPGRERERFLPVQCARSHCLCRADDKEINQEEEEEETPVVVVVTADWQTKRDTNNDHAMRGKREGGREGVRREGNGAANATRRLHNHGRH